MVHLFVLVYTNRIISDNETSGRETDFEYQEGLLKRKIVYLVTRLSLVRQLSNLPQVTFWH